jgi:hypothetical protein
MRYCTQPTSAWNMHSRYIAENMKQFTRSELTVIQQNVTVCYMFQNTKFQAPSLRLVSRYIQGDSEHKYKTYVDC